MRNFLVDSAKFSLLFVVVLLIASWIGYLCQYDADYFRIPESKKYLVVGDSHLECSMNTSLDGFVNISQSSEIYMFTYLKIKNVLETNAHIEHVFVDFCNFQVDKQQDSIIYSENYLNSRYPLYYALLGKEEFEHLTLNNELPFIKTHIKALPKVSREAMTSVNVLTNHSLGGFSPLTRLLTDSFVNIASQETILPADMAKLNMHYLLKIVALCKEKKVSLYLIRTPLHPAWPYLQNEAFFQKNRQELLDGVVFLDFKQLALGNQHFADLEHLNEKGAHIFSTFFAGLIAENLLEKDDPQLYINAEIKEYNTRN